MRIWWVIAFLVCVAWCTVAISSIWLRWQQRPVIVSFNDRTTSIEAIPFPAFTVCSTEKFSYDKIDTNLFEEVITEMVINETAYKRLSPEEYDYFHFVEEFIHFFPIRNTESKGPLLNVSCLIIHKTE